MSNKKQGSFTLIELLIVIAIIGILAAVVIFGVRTASQNARDTRRMEDIRTIEKAVVAFYADRGTYPRETFCDSSIGSNVGVACPAGGTDWDSASNFYTDVVGGGFIPQLPKDPINNSTYYYNYEPNVTNYCIMFKSEKEADRCYYVEGGTGGNSCGAIAGWFGCSTYRSL